MLQFGYSGSKRFTTTGTRAQSSPCCTYGSLLPEPLSTISHSSASNSLLILLHGRAKPAIGPEQCSFSPSTLAISSASWWYPPIFTFDPLILPSQCPPSALFVITAICQRYCSDACQPPDAHKALVVLWQRSLLLVLEVCSCLLYTSPSPRD